MAAAEASCGGNMLVTSGVPGAESDMIEEPPITNCCRSVWSENGGDMIQSSCCRGCRYTELLCGTIDDDDEKPDEEL